MPPIPSIIITIIHNTKETKHIPNNIRNIIEIETKVCLYVMIIIQNIGITRTGKSVKKKKIELKKPSS
jgi:hypothetical protein